MNTTSETSFQNLPAGPREEQSYALVLFSGLATTALTLVGVYVLNTKTTDFHIMGWYANYVLPVGALLVGLAASSGYGLASWFSGIKITRSLLWLVLLFQLAAYFAAEYVEFKSLRLVHRGGAAVGFLEYFDLMARSFAWKQDNGTAGQPLGLWGYAFRGLEVIGFVGGSIIVPALLRKAPYCHACQRYMRTRQLGLIPASVQVKKVKKSDVAGLAAYEAEQSLALAAGTGAWEALQKLAADANAAGFQKSLADLAPGKKAAAKLPRRLSVHLVQCNRCYSGWLLAKTVTGQGNQIKQTEFARADLHPEFVRAVQR
jgi:uncharacterized membrane protein